MVVVVVGGGLTWRRRSLHVNIYQRDAQCGRGSQAQVCERAEPGGGGIGHIHMVSRECAFSIQLAIT